MNFRSNFLECWGSNKGIGKRKKREKDSLENKQSEHNKKIKKEKQN